MKKNIKYNGVVKQCLFETVYFEKGEDFAVSVDFSSFLEELLLFVNASKTELFLSEWVCIQEQIKKQGSMIASYLFGFSENDFIIGGPVCVQDGSGLSGCKSRYRMDVCKADNYLKASLYEIEAGESL